MGCHVSTSALKLLMSASFAKNLLKIVTANQAGIMTNKQEANRIPVTDSESQPRVPHHRAYGFASGHAAWLRISMPSRAGICTRRFRSDSERARVRRGPKPAPEYPHASHRDGSRPYLAVRSRRGGIAGTSAPRLGYPHSVQPTSLLQPTVGRRVVNNRQGTVAGQTF
jgi:hypothetical protein